MVLSDAHAGVDDNMFGKKLQATYNGRDPRYVTITCRGPEKERRRGCSGKVEKRGRNRRKEYGWSRSKEESGRVQNI